MARYDKDNDPGQLLREAAALERRADEHLSVAQIYLDRVAIEIERVAAEHLAARQLKRAAADYRQWAAEQAPAAAG